MTEDRIIEELVSPYREYGPRVVVGVGDDCAVIRENVAKELLITVDSVVEGVHFTFSLLRPEEIGHRGLTAALSDIAAMGGEPLGVLINAQVPQDGVEKLKEIYRGFNHLLKEYCVDLLGGNITKGENFALTFTVLGEVSRGKAWRRDGARDGDLVFITGDVGRVKSFLMLEKLNAKGYEWWFRETRLKFVNPEPKLKEVMRIKSEGIEVHSAIDISDGLAIDLWRLARSSEVSIFIDLNAIPIKDSVRYVAENLKKDPYEVALSSGEEYELVLTVPKEYGKIMEDLKFIQIGEVKLGEVGVFDTSGNRIQPLGWQHFK
ncbi:MAG: thiamine-phosphate kinase [candidate division WOR-3 bacterium]